MNADLGWGGGDGEAAPAQSEALSPGLIRGALWRVKEERGGCCRGTGSTTGNTTFDIGNLLVGGVIAHNRGRRKRGLTGAKSTAIYNIKFPKKVIFRKTVLRRLEAA